MFENLKCLLFNFPWDLFWMLLLPLLMLWWLMQRIINRQKRTIGEVRRQVDHLERELDRCRKELGNTTTIPPLGLMATHADTDRKDDLKMVEGIGPKIEEIINKAGIYTFTSLANTTPAELMTILVKEGPKYQVHNPTTWPAQALMARDGLWDQLKEWQDQLKGGQI